MQNRLGNIKNYQPKYRYDLPLKSVQPQTKRSARTAVSNTPLLNQPSQEKTISSHLKVLEPEEYATLQLSLSAKLKNLQENVKVCQQKSKIKDKEMQTLAEAIGKLSLKALSEDKAIKKKERQLQKISFRCQELTSNISGDQEKINKEVVYLHEETNKYHSLQEMASSLQDAMREGQLQLERKKQICQLLEGLKQENQNLKEYHHQLMNEEKLIEYRQNQDRGQLMEMERKKEQLQKVLKERTRINKNNQSKLNKVAKEIETLEMGVTRSEISENQIPSIELEIGDLNQDLLFINDEISELQFKIKRKHNQNEELKAKLFYVRQQITLPVQSNQKQMTDKKGKEKEKSRVEALHKEGQAENLNKSSPKGGELAHATPTFPSNISNEAYFNSEPPRGLPREEESSKKETYRDLQKLIKRYEQIVSKDKNE